METARSPTCREKAGILKTPGTFGLGVAVFDFDNDGWPDIYVANDSTSSALYKNNHDGTFQEIAIEAGVAYSADGKPQAGMGVSVADYDCDGNFDLVKTNFAGDTTSLYRNLGGGVFEDQTFQAGMGKITRFLGWGVAFVDYDNDGWAGHRAVQRARLSGGGRDPRPNRATGSGRWCTGICGTAGSRRSRSKWGRGSWRR